jgi:hypothetical protein
MFIPFSNQEHRTRSTFYQLCIQSMAWIHDPDDPQFKDPFRLRKIVNERSKDVCPDEVKELLECIEAEKRGEMDIRLCVAPCRKLHHCVASRYCPDEIDRYIEGCKYEWLFPRIETSQQCWNAWWALHDCFKKKDLIEMLLVPPKETDPKDTVGLF